MTLAREAAAPSAGERLRLFVVDAAMRSFGFGLPKRNSFPIQFSENSFTASGEKSRRISFTLHSRSMRRTSPRSDLETNVEAEPRCPARPVRPTRWMKSSGP